MKLSEIAHILNGNLISDGEFKVLDFCTSGTDESFLTFLEKPKFADRISKNASCILCTSEARGGLPPFIKGIFETDEPKYCFYMIHNSFFNYREKAENIIDETAKIDSSAKIAGNNVKIGKNTVIKENVTIYENVSIGDNVIIHANCVIGGRSFDFAKGTDGKIIGWTDAGRVLIGNDVEICAMSHIAQGVLDRDVTFIDDKAKIDSFVHIGHSAKIGKRALVAAGAVIGGNSIIGEDAWVGINATVSNRIKVGNNAKISLGAVVTKNVDEFETVTGNFAIEHGRFINNLKESII